MQKPLVNNLNYYLLFWNDWSILKRCSAVLKCLNNLLGFGATICCYMGAEKSLEKAVASLGARAMLHHLYFQAQLPALHTKLNSGKTSLGLLKRELKVTQSSACGLTKHGMHLPGHCLIMYLTCVWLYEVKLNTVHWDQAMQKQQGVPRHRCVLPVPGVVCPCSPAALLGSLCPTGWWGRAGQAPPLLRFFWPDSGCALPRHMALFDSHLGLLVVALVGARRTLTCSGSLENGYRGFVGALEDGVKQRKKQKGA